MRNYLDEFTFYRHIEYTTWSKESYTIEADGYEEAEKKFLELLSSGTEDDYSNDDFEVTCEDLTDTGNEELYNETGDLIGKDSND